MKSAPQDQVFSIPFRYLWNTSFSGELEIHGEQTAEIARFVGDHANQNLKVFSESRVNTLIDRIESCVWPITLFGSSGTGKTSLALTVIADVAERLASERQSSKGTTNRPQVMSSSDFDRRFRSAIETDSVSDFRRRLLGCRGLVIDDLHQLGGKPASQKELLQLIDEFDRRNRPLIFTINRDPNVFDELLPQLSSRLSGGLCLPVRAPGRQARRIIVRDLCRINQLNITPAGQALIVDRLAVTVPRIVGFFLHLRTLLSLESDQGNKLQTIDVEFIQQQFTCSPKELDQLATIVINRIAKSFGVKVSELRDNSRKQTITQARAIAIYLQRELLGMTFSRIGSYFGNRDHSTVMHAHRKIKTMIAAAQQDDRKPLSSDALVARVLQIEKELKNQFSGKIRLA
jgi:chromosomal replication initiator protein